MEVGESRWWWPGITVTTAALLVISTLLVYVVVVQLRRKSFPPGPWPLPIFGNLGVLSGLPHRNLHKLAAKYGGLMYLQLGMHCSGNHLFGFPDVGSSIEFCSRDGLWRCF